MCLWNLHKLAEALDPNVPLTDESKANLSHKFSSVYTSALQSQMSKKFGFSDSENHLFTPAEKQLATEFW